jgi:hypothetical protein
VTTPPLAGFLFSLISHLFGHFGGLCGALFRQLCPRRNSILAGTSYIAGMGRDESVPKHAVRQNPLREAGD